jgi:hypothetical protein
MRAPGAIGSKVRDLCVRMYSGRPPDELDEVSERSSERSLRRCLGWGEGLRRRLGRAVSDDDDSWYEV